MEQIVVMGQLISRGGRRVRRDLLMLNSFSPRSQRTLRETNYNPKRPWVFGQTSPGFEMMVQELAAETLFLQFLYYLFNR